MLLLVALALLQVAVAQQSSAIEACQVSGTVTAHSVQEFAICLANRKDHIAAGDAFYRAAGIATEPRDKAVMLYNAGSSYQGATAAGAQRAQEAYAQCLLVSGDMFRPCHIKIASLYRDAEDPEAVMRHLKQAIRLDPLSPDAYSYLADTLNNLKRFREAVEMYDEAIARDSRPGSPQLHLSKGESLGNVKDHAHALEAFSTAKTLSPVGSSLYVLASVGHFFASLELGRWRLFELRSVELLMAVRSALALPWHGMGAPSVLSPYRALFIDLSSADVAREISVRWTDGLTQGAARLPNSSAAALLARVGAALPPRPQACDGFVIGYLSRRFHDYPGTQMMLRLFGSHRRKGGSCVFSFATGSDDGSVERRTVVNDSDLFIDMSALGSDEGAAIIAAYDVDVLVDYDGLHEFNNQRMLAHGPSPIEVTWLGFAGPSGGGLRRSAEAASTRPHLRYVLVDSIVVPPDAVDRAADAYTEHIAYLPHTYQPQDELQNEVLLLKLGEQQSLLQLRRRGVRATSAARSGDRERLLSQYGAGGVGTLDLVALVNRQWLVSFNRQAKIQPETLEDWALILRRRPEAVLVLLAEAPEVVKEMRAHLASAGVGPGRALFFGRLPRADYRALLHCSDLFLDIRPYGAHTVASDAMFGGVPVATLQGPSFAARVAASLNRAAGVELMTSHTRKEFVDSVVAVLASSADTLPGLAAAMRGGCLFDSSSFARHLESLYLSMAEVAGEVGLGAGMHLWLQETACGRSM